MACANAAEAETGALLFPIRFIAALESVAGPVHTECIFEIQRLARLHVLRITPATSKARVLQRAGPPAS
jgi:hypothetical protein